METKDNIDAIVNSSPGFLSSVEDAVCGFWMGANWPTTKWYETNMGMIDPLYYAGGVRTCERVARKYGMDGMPMKEVRHASIPITVSYYAGCVFGWPVNFPLRFTRGILGSIFLGESE